MNVIVLETVLWTVLLTRGSVVLYRGSTENTRDSLHYLDYAASSGVLAASHYSVQEEMLWVESALHGFAKLRSMRVYNSIEAIRRDAYHPVVDWMGVSHFLDKSIKLRLLRGLPPIMLPFIKVGWNAEGL